MQVKLFDYESEQDLEDAVNDFLDNDLEKSNKSLLSSISSLLVACLFPFLFNKSTPSKSDTRLS